MNNKITLPLCFFALMLIGGCNVKLPSMVVNPPIIEYSSVVLIAPADNQIIALDQGLIFQWQNTTNNLPDTVIYNLVLVERLPGQSLIEALSENDKIIDENIINNFEYYDPNLDLPSKTNNFIWSVRTLDSQGNPINLNKIWARPHQFRMTGCFESDIVDVFCIGQDGPNLIYRVTIRVTNFGDNIGTYEERNNTIPPYIRGSSPSLPTISNISLPNGSPTASLSNFDDIDFDLTINNSSTTAHIELYVWQTELDGDICQEILFETIELPPCCFDCSSRQFSISTTPTVNSDNTVLVSGSFTGVGTSNIKSVKAKLNWFRFLNSDELCQTCLQNSSQTGNFILPSDITDPRFNTGQMIGNHIPPQSRAITWQSSNARGSDISAPVPISLTISVPVVNTLSCCTDAIEFCIQYQFIEMDCLVCESNICYQINR